MAKEQKNAAGRQQQPAKPAAAGKRKKEFKKKREKRIVPHGIVHVAASFNNTQITIADPDGARIMRFFGRGDRVQGLAQRYAVRGAAGRAVCGGNGSRPVRDEERGSEDEGAGVRARIRGARAGGGGIAHRGDPRHYADSAQRLPSTEAPARVRKF